MENQNLQLTILTRERVMFEGEINAVSSMNAKGKFDILPQHANFISLIKDQVVIYKTDGGVDEIPINHGILRYREGKITIFLGLGIN